MGDMLKRAKEIIEAEAEALRRIPLDDSFEVSSEYAL
jgi:hypothetical protein